MKIHPLIYLVAFETACAITSARAATLTVTNTKDSDAGSLRQAISDAAAGDTIVFQIPTSDRGFNPDTGAYTISLTSGELGVGKNLTITGPGQKVLNVLRSAAIGTPTFRVFNIAKNFNVTISGLAIGNGSANAGGGIFSGQGSTLTLNDVLVSANAAGSGGGIFAFGSMTTITNSTISGNTGNGATGGGGIRSFSTLVLTNSTVSGNSVIGGGTGGGIATDSNLTITSSTISGNQLPNSGGNFNGIGGGIYINGGKTTIVNSTITANTISRDGAGGGGIYGGNVTLRNTIVALNTKLGAANDIQGTVALQGFNILGNSSGATISSQQPNDQIGVSADQLNLGPLQDNGGPTFTHALLGNSVALERGNSSGSTTDQRGLPRPVDSPKIANADGGDGSDIGAYEVQADQLFGCADINVVNNNDDSGPGSLRDVMANVCAGSTITFADTVQGEINLTSGELAINKALTINGPGANLLSVQRSSDDGTPDFRIFDIIGNFVVAISGLTISNGNVPGVLDFGGGIYNQNGALTLTNCAVSGNSAGFSGGGISNAGTLVMDGCTISGNSASASGGIAGGNAETITNSTISGNTAKNNAGGISIGPGTSVTNCTITGNSAGDSGGGIFNNGAGGDSLDARNTIIALNTAPTGPDISGPLTSQGFNLVGDDSDATITPAQDSDQIGVSADELKLGPLQDNGGPTLTHALLPGSVAIDQGDSSGSVTDQRGQSRPVDVPEVDNAEGGDGADIGAFEAQLTEAAPASQLLNLSTRKQVGTGDNVLIGGFIVVGSEDKKILMRGLGPSLPVNGALADPTLELHDATSALLAVNDNWREKQDEILATGIPPTNDLESAIVATLGAKPLSEGGAGYTGVLAGKGGTTGIGVLEIYDLAVSANSKLANISTRGFVGTGDDVLIGGFIPGPSDRTTMKVLLRAIGPSLSGAGVSGALQDPVLELHDSNGNTLMTNDDWKDAQQTEIEATGIPPTDERESAILTTLAPSNSGYTAIVRGANDTTGVAVVEVYTLD